MSKLVFRLRLLLDGAIMSLNNDMIRNPFNATLCMWGPKFSIPQIIAKWVYSVVLKPWARKMYISMLKVIIDDISDFVEMDTVKLEIVIQLNIAGFVYIVILSSVHRGYYIHRALEDGT